MPEFWSSSGGLRPAHFAGRAEGFVDGQRSPCPLGHPVDLAEDEVLHCGLGGFADQDADAVTPWSSLRGGEPVLTTSPSRCTPWHRRPHVAHRHHPVDADADVEFRPAPFPEGASSLISRCIRAPSGRRGGHGRDRPRAPQKAMMASPMYLSTVPRWWRSPQSWRRDSRSSRWVSSRGRGLPKWW